MENKSQTSQWRGGAKAKNYKLTLLACYCGFISQAIAANFAPLLFVTFAQTYKISLGQLTLIPTIFFFTQLIVDYFCATVVDRIGYRPCSIASQIATGLGVAGLAFLPDLLPSAFAGIIMCVVVYAFGSGLVEVLGSPIVEACPFENKSAVMSTLHSFYCRGSAAVIGGSTLFFSIFGIHNWRVLAVVWSLVPFINIINFAMCPINKLVENGQSMTVGQLLRTKLFWLFIVLMVCAGASEIAMSQWASAFAESALHVSKTVGDLAGPCGFALFMAISRTIYGKFGEKMDLYRFMIASGILCLIAYLLAGFAQIPLIGLIGCMLCGFSVGIMWPGSISISSHLLPTSGTALFALLALAGDLGGTLGPGLVGEIAQAAGGNLQIGVISGLGFPIILVICVLFVRNKKSNKSEKELA